MALNPYFTKRRLTQPLLHHASLDMASPKQNEALHYSTAPSITPRCRTFTSLHKTELHETAPPHGRTKAELHLTLHRITNTLRHMTMPKRYLTPQNITTPPQDEASRHQTDTMHNNTSPLHGNSPYGYLRAICFMLSWV
jgi:hypothetical protein